MERSKDELLAGIEALEPEKPFPDEIFYRIFEIGDGAVQTQYLGDMRGTDR